MTTKIIELYIPPRNKIDYNKDIKNIKLQYKKYFEDNYDSITKQYDINIPKDIIEKMYFDKINLRCNSLKYYRKVK